MTKKELRKELEETRVLAADLATALRLTQEYVGDAMLPPRPGWSWFDALQEYNDFVSPKSPQPPEVKSDGHAVAAIGYISAELAHRSGAWDGDAPDWFPEPPEWLELWNKGLTATADAYA